jgi:serine/threonine protein kinase
VTAAVASPELLDGAGIGLETDVYALGMVMWEVFTRRKAWHWIQSGPFKDLAIVAQVTQGRRPKMPESLSRDCARHIRRCLHQDPAQRPTAKAITQWINTCRSELAEVMKGEKDEVVKESDQEEGKDGITWRPMKMNHRAIHDRTDEHWSLRGLYVPRAVYVQICMWTLYVNIYVHITYLRYTEQVLPAPFPA